MQTHRREAVSQRRLLAVPHMATACGVEGNLNQQLNALTYKYMHTSPTWCNRGLRVRHDFDLRTCNDKASMTYSANCNLTSWRRSSPGSTVKFHSAA